MSSAKKTKSTHRPIKGYAKISVLIATEKGREQHGEGFQLVARVPVVGDVLADDNEGLFIVTHVALLLVTSTEKIGWSDLDAEVWVDRLPSGEPSVPDMVKKYLRERR